MSRLLKAPQFLFKCEECNYKDTIKGLWVVITTFPEVTAYSFLCIDCDIKKNKKKADL